MPYLSSLFPTYLNGNVKNCSFNFCSKVNSCSHFGQRNYFKFSSCKHLSQNFMQNTFYYESVFSSDLQQKLVTTRHTQQMSPKQVCLLVFLLISLFVFVLHTQPLPFNSVLKRAHFRLLCWTKSTQAKVPVKSSRGV